VHSNFSRLRTLAPTILWCPLSLAESATVEESVKARPVGRAFLIKW
jgi:hypothetical protein